MESSISYKSRSNKVIWTAEQLLQNFATFDQILKESGLKDEKIMEELKMTAPTLRNRKKEPVNLTVGQLEILSLLLSNGRAEFPTSSLLDFIRVKHL